MSEVSEHIKDDYKVVGIVPGPVKFQGFGTVDFRTVSKEVADKLYEKGCIYLKKKPKRSTNNKKQ